MTIDEAITKVMLNYFETIREVFPDAWNSLENPLSRTIGYGALVKILKDLCKIGLALKEPTLEKKFFIEYINKAKHLTFSFAKYSANGGGETNLYKDLYTAIITNA